MPRLFHANRPKINRCDIECRFRAPVNRRRHQADDIVRAQAVHHIGEKRERCPTAQWPHQCDRKKVRRELQRTEDRSEQSRQEIDPTRALKHVDRDQHRHEKRNDFQDHAKTFLRSFHEFVVNLYAADSRVDGKEAEQKRNREQGKRVDGAETSTIRTIERQIGRRCGGFSMNEISSGRAL